jgi:hypothetical protein
MSPVFLLWRFILNAWRCQMCGKMSIGSTCIWCKAARPRD